MADEFLKMDESVKELSKFPILALDALHGKFICADGMTNDVYAKRYSYVVFPISKHCGAAWHRTVISLSSVFMLLVPIYLF